MIQWLLHRYMSDGSATRDARVRARFGTVGSAVGVGVNAALAAIKLGVGLAVGSVAVTADAANNLGDMASSVMSLVSVRISQKHADREHPFGHGRAEYIGALGVGLLILVMAVELVHSAIASIITPVQPVLGAAAVALLLVSIGAKVCLWRFYDELGEAIDSAPLRAAAKDSLGDVLATSAVVASMLIAAATGVVLDGWMGLLVAVLVARNGVGVCRETLDDLLGGRTNPELGREITSILEGYDGVLGTHDLMIHDYGPGRCVASVHAEVAADGNIITLHEMIDRAENEIQDHLGIPICIHMDPVITGDAETDRIHEALASYLAEEYPGFSLHDLRRVPGEKRVNVVFDVAVPADFGGQELLHAKLEARAREIEPRARCVIRFDIDLYHGVQQGE